MINESVHNNDDNNNNNNNINNNNNNNNGNNNNNNNNLSKAVSTRVGKEVECPYIKKALSMRNI